MKTPDRCEAVLHQARKTASEGSILVFGATEDPPSGLLQLLFIQSQKGNSRKLNFRFTEFSEVGPGTWRLLSGGRHGRGAAQGEPFLRGQDDRRMRTLHPPELGGHPLIDRLLYGRRLDHQLAGVDKRGQPLLLLQGSIQVNRLHPVEGGPNSPPLTALFLDKQPELLSSRLAQGFFLRSHEQPPLSLQAPGSEAVFFEVGEQLLF